MKRRNTRSWLAGFLARPRQTWVRAAVFQLHLWAGLGIGLYALAIGVSGSALVFQDEIHGVTNPGLYRVAESETHASLDSVVKQSTERFPEYTVGGIAGFDELGNSLLLWMNPVSNRAPAERGINVYFNPHNGVILGARDPYQGVLGWFANLHYFLLMGDSGAKANGVLAVVLLALCLSGLVIWWPGIRNWQRGFRFNLRGSWRCLNWDLHSNGGFWISTILIALCLTAIYFEFPAPVAAAVAKASGMKMEEARAWLVPPKSSTANGTRIRFDEAFTIGERNLPEGAVPTYLIAPAGADDVFTLLGKHPGNPLMEGRVAVYIDQHSGQVISKMDSRAQKWGVKLILMTYPIHFGTWGGVFSKCLWVLVGLTPGLLFLSGFLMWWNRVIRKKLRARTAAV